MKLPMIGKKPQQDYPVKIWVYDELCAKRETVPSSQIPTSARLTRMKNGTVCAMERVAVEIKDEETGETTQTSELRLFNPTQAFLDNDINITPDELYGALDWAVEVRFQHVASPWLQRIKSGVMIALVGICLFALFMIASSVFQG